MTLNFLCCYKRIGWVIVVLAVQLFLSSCSNPWYKPYGIESEQALYSSSSVPKIVNALDDESDSIRYLAIVALKNIGEGAKDAIPAITKAVKDPHRNVRGRAIEALREIGLVDEETARASIPGLVLALEDPDANYRLNATETLHQIGVKFPATRDLLVAPLKKAMEDVHPNVCLKALAAINEISPGSDEAKKLFKILLSHQNASTRRNAVLELREDLYPKETFFEFLDHMANHDPRATVRRDALIYLKWGNSKERTPAVAASREPYFTIEESENGFVQFEMNFVGGSVPVSAIVIKKIEGYSMPGIVSLKRPQPERPGKHQYFLKIVADAHHTLLGDEKLEHDVILAVEEGKLTKCKINVIRQEGVLKVWNSALSSSSVSFREFVTVDAPVAFSL